MIVLDGYCYSLNDEEYYEDLCYVLDMARDDELDSIYEGEQVPHKHSDFIRPHYIIEQIQERAFDTVAEEIAREYLDTLSDIDIEELGEVISNFLDKKVGPPKFYAIKNAKLVPVRELS